MHASSLENMQRCYDFYVAARRVGRGEKLTVLEIGSEEFNGAYRHIFADDRFAYIGCDRAPGPGVDPVLDDPTSSLFPTPRRISSSPARYWSTRRVWHCAAEATWYLKKHPDVAAAGYDAREHFLKHSQFEGRAWQP